MSMVINLVEDHNIYLCEGGPVYNGGVQPITYLTQWKIVGNSEVHLGNLTSWKIEGNSVVDNNAILSCGDYSDVDGKYHVKISNGVDIYDIVLTEPLRKVNDVADTIEFPSSVEGKALVARNFSKANLGSFNWLSRSTRETGKNRYSTSVNMEVLPNCIGSTTSISKAAIALCSKYNILSPVSTYNHSEGMGIFDSSNVSDGQIFIYDSNANTLTPSDFKNYIQGVELIYQITPTTELVDAPQIAVSPTDTYTSANVTPYSAFEHTENKEIWSCGEYNPIDGKYHILVQPLGGSIADIALDEPLRKVNDVADTIEYADGVATLTRNIKSGILGNYTWSRSNNRLRTTDIVGMVAAPSSNSVAADIICATYPTLTTNQSSLEQDSNIAVASSGNLFLYDTEYPDITTAVIRNQLIAKIQDMEIIFRLATPTTETIQVPQIAEADSYTCEISQGAKAVEWSSFETE